MDEQGTEAAAATAVTMAVAGAAKQADSPIEFKADHPFLFFLRDVRSGLVLTGQGAAVASAGERSPVIWRHLARELAGCGRMLLAMDIRKRASKVVKDMLANAAAKVIAALIKTAIGEAARRLRDGKKR